MNVNGHPLICPHCQSRSFSHKKVLLNTAGMTFFNMDWLNKSADTFVCARCQRIEWFVDAFVEAGDASLGDGVERDCPRCGTYLSAATEICPNCKSLQ